MPDATLLGRLAAPDHAAVEVVRDGSRRRQHHAGHHGQDGGERDRGDRREEDVATRGPGTAALQLRAMNITYEITKERGAIILIPTSMVDSLNPAITLALVNQKVERMAKAA